MKLKDLSVNFKLASKFFLIIKNAKFPNDHFLLVDDEIFFSVIQANFGDLEIVGIDVLDYVYIIVNLDNNLLLAFDHLLSSQR